MNKLFFASLFTLFTFLVQGQITGTVFSSEDNQALQNVKVISSDGQKTLTNYAGEFTLTPAKYPVKVIVSMIQFVNDTIDIKSAGPITILLKTRIKDESTVVVSAGKRKQAIEEIPVSMEIIKASPRDGLMLTLTSILATFAA